MNTCPVRHEKFVDSDKCFNIIKDLQCKLNDNAKDDDYEIRNEAERLVENFRKVIDPYQEQPELLDPYLADLILSLTDGLNDFNISSSRYHTVFKFLYQLIKVTGFKSIIKKFPHETDKLPLLTELLSKEDPRDKTNWQTRYVLTVWLSIVILTPFDLSKFDSDSTESSISERIYSTLMRSLSLHDSCQHVTAYCLAKFFSRPDVIKSDEHPSKFITTSLDELKNVKLGAVNSMDDVQLIGRLRTLAYMYKFLPRTEMKARSSQILDVLIKMDVDKINRELVNHMIVKLIQRAGLALLPKRVAAWRYKRGSRILGHIDADTEEKSLRPDSEHHVERQNTMGEPVDDDSEESDSADYLESIFNSLFVAAHNSQTRIRWSASKGIARLASRLSRERASEVVNLVISNFFDPVASNEFAWHSGCLTLAEMSRHGLVPEEKLVDVTRMVSEAIIYDKIKGSFAVGAHVREAACYVCWAIARTYEDHLLKPHISTISTNLLCTMLFDRELQCRRAASATFQELIGRQGTFNEEGISILTNVDYQNVGQRPNAYLHLALQVASYGEKYSLPFVEHLIEKKIGHWDVQIRRLASDSLAALMLHTDLKYVSTDVLPSLMKLIDQNSDNNAKHGAILALAKVIRALVPLSYSFELELVQFVGSMVEKCEKQLKSKQQAPNFIEAICFVICSAGLASFSFRGKGEVTEKNESEQEENTIESGILKQWESVALMALDNDNSPLRDVGSDALLTLYKNFYKDNKTNQDRVLTTLNKALASLNESTRCGALRALSKLSQVVDEHDNKEDTDTRCIKFKRDAETPDIILMSLASYIAKETREKPNDIVFAQAKAEACEAFVEFIRHVDKLRLVVSTNLLQAGYEALLEKTEDYTFDKRGDIGVVVRRAAIRALQELTLYLLSIGLNSLFKSQPLVTKIIAKTLQQAVSYNNSARELAGLSFYRLMGSSLPGENIPHREEILKLFEHYGVDEEFNWRDSSTPIFVSLLSKTEYSADLWIGLLPAIGQPSDLCAKQFRDALSDYIRSLSSSSKNGSESSDQVFECFLDTLERDQLPDRLLTSGLSAADYLLTQGLMNDTSLQLQQRLVQFSWQSRRATDPKRLLSVSRVLSSMLQFNDGRIQRQALAYCLGLLLNGYSKVRQYTAEQLFLSIMTYEQDLEQHLANDEGPQELTQKPDLEGAMDLLRQTNWAEPLEKIRPVRDEICARLKLEAINTTTTSSASASTSGQQ